jgi:hypothetical protein
MLRTGRKNPEPFAAAVKHCGHCHYNPREDSSNATTDDHATNVKSGPVNSVRHGFS